MARLAELYALYVIGGNGGYGIVALTERVVA